MRKARLVAVLVPLLLVRVLSAQSLYDRAKAARERHQLDSSYALAQQAAEAEPNRAEVQYLLGDVACGRAQASGGLGAYGPARTCKAAYGRALALEPDNPLYLESLAQFLSQAPGIVGGDRDSALRLATRLQGIDDSRGTMLAVGILWRGGASEKLRADSMAESLARRHAGDRSTLLRVASHYQGTNRPERALPIDEQLLAVNESDVIARFGVGRNLVALQRDPRRAIDLLKAVIAAPRPPEGQPTYVLGAPYWRLGQAWVQVGQPDSARAAYQEALRLNPQLAQAQRSLDSLSRR